MLVVRWSSSEYLLEMQPKYFATPLAFRAWLETCHARKDELLVGFYKRDSGKANISWPESVDQALCFGWIDGVRKRIDDERYSIRFTPRRPTSIWSAVNIKRVAELTEQGHMQPAGRAAFERRTEAKSRIYAYENSSATVLSAEYQKKLLDNKRAWAFFQAQAAWYRRTAIHRIMSAKKEETRLKRLDALMAGWAAGTRA